MKSVGGCRIIAQCCSSGFIAALTSRLPDASTHSAGVTWNGLFVGMKSAARKNSWTKFVTARPMLESLSVMPTRFHATNAANIASTQAQKSSEPSRPAHQPDSLKSHARLDTSVEWFSTTYRNVQSCLKKAETRTRLESDVVAATTNVAM